VIGQISSQQQEIRDVGQLREQRLIPARRCPRAVEIADCRDADDAM
jgi:hypothetical protein